MRSRTPLLIVLAVARAHAQSAPSPEVAKEFQAGVDAFRLGKYDEARAHLEKARSLDDKLPGPYRFLAAVARAEAKWQECLDDARHALVLNPRSIEAPETRKLYEECRAGAGKIAYRGGELGDSAAVAVTSNAPGATVKIGGLAYGGTPLAPRPITAGKLELEVTKLGWKPAKLEVDAPAGIVTDVDVELEPDPNAGAEVVKQPPTEKPTTGTLAIAARAGELAIDGHPSRLGDPTALPPGEHVVELRAPGADPWRRRVRIVAGIATKLEPQLVDAADRRHTEHIGLAVLGASAALLATGFAFGLASESATATARDIVRVETARDPSIPLSASTAVEPLRTRADLAAAESRANRDALISDIAYGAALAAGITAAYYLYKGARERHDGPPPFAIAPTPRGAGALVGKTFAW